MGSRTSINQGFRRSSSGGKVDTLDSKSGGESREGANPSWNICFDIGFYPSGETVDPAGLDPAAKA